MRFDELAEAHASIQNKQPIDWFCLKMYAQSPVTALHFIEQKKTC